MGRQIARVPGARRQGLLALLLLSLGAAATVAVPWQLGRIVDIVIRGESLWEAVAWLVAAAVAGAGLSAAGFFYVSRLSERVIAHLREEMVGTALGLPVHRVEDAGTGDLVSRSTDDVAVLSSAVTETVPILSSSLFTILATSVALVTLNWRFLLVLVVVAPLYWIASRRYLAVAPGRYAAERASMADCARKLLEAIHGQAWSARTGWSPRRASVTSQAVVDHGFGLSHHDRPAGVDVCG